MGGKVILVKVNPLTRNLFFLLGAKPPCLNKPRLLRNKHEFLQVRGQGLGARGLLLTNCRPPHNNLLLTNCWQHSPLTPDPSKGYSTQRIVRLFVYFGCKYKYVIYTLILICHYVGLHDLYSNFSNLYHNYIMILDLSLIAILYK